MKSLSVVFIAYLLVLKKMDPGFASVAVVTAGTLSANQLVRLFQEAGKEGDHSGQFHRITAMLPDAPFLQLRNGENVGQSTGRKENPKIVTVRRGESAYLQCEVLGMPSPVAFWTKGGAPVLQEQNGKGEAGARQSANMMEVLSNSGRPMLEHAVTMARLRLTCATPSDAGVYECNGDNGVDKAVAYTKVNVETNDDESGNSNDCQTDTTNDAMPPMIYMYTEMRLEYPGNDAQLICRAFGRPPPKISWFNSNGTPIKTGQNFTVLPNGDLLAKRINFGVHQPFRQFNCQAVNSLGIDVAIIDLLTISRVT